MSGVTLENNWHNILSNENGCSVTANNANKAPSDEEEDFVVDLNTGSLEPVSLNHYMRMLEVTEKFGQL
ncbi:hypothetical protein KAFR_0C04140 [Kazachstania africana CBS 2517]|uniref:Uncharacterized protein n=1 Tax=Kazachstania africana (strain ATCC 22294 / BCRC 22015 / CBS 2517 / CECT 1963 / NBRC 1671 / NRRL Y-8276) TaxID=1071382 RepID=H2ASQ5_KAZAF|nr:hypothetical protein KAFR_0C04140 [Kazachstania africana CBS 2517]CCF57405.1 hypothetical protein KAFR_0C04140 [Kazachstania africana CBS 2517]